MRAIVIPVIISVASSVGFAAHGVAAVIESMTMQVPAASIVTIPAAAPPPEKSAAQIIERNPFDSARPAPTYTLGSRPAAACGAITVHAIVHSNDDAWSFASLSTKDEQVLARKGAGFAGREVAYVGKETVWLADQAGQLCRVELAAKLDAPLPEQKTAQPATRGAARPVDPEIAKGIRATSPNTYDIDRATFERIMTSTAELMGDVRVGPDAASGKVSGMKLTHLRQGSVLGLVGLKEGDRLDAINGIDLTSPEAGLEAYAKLRLAPHIVLKVTRDGKPSELQYDIR